ncbi:PEP/pyruvate-binding domain-containing protein [Pseudonocardia asaccharolytica]|uniref:Pyruvate, phosphate dikinase n=1 Tax=Pseudonocardia asaccharolytica DSM 44247 = NBRC 16224 TaxID=1123024 RepID=A0A511D1Z1_9PSEU|nr:PEP/pyruvate-binding domain-containing protein [Pseudonocardia asaccharolytica]GEL18806.1 pyruvate, phosphate dikinase [Pseudonocardia asaccharolytica DSM 44247 = NBRC 16224]
MTTSRLIVELGQAREEPRPVLGGKAVTLGALAGAGFPVPPGFVVPPGALDEPEALDRAMAGAAARLGPGPFAVRSSGAAEDLADASYAGLYETFLDVAADELPAAIRRCFASATGERVAAYRLGAAERGEPAAMAVLVQPMVAVTAAGVAFTAHPVTGARDTTVVTAIAGRGERLVAGEAGGEEWTVRGTHVERIREAVGEPVLDAGRAAAVAALARRVAEHYGIPQDIEWAFDGDRLVLLQARPMTALPEPVVWAPPGPGLWMRNFRLGEWLPEAMTPLFADWLLPRIEAGYLAGMRADVGTVVPFRYAAVHGWYYNALPIPSPRLLARVLVQGRGRAVWFLFNALIRVSRNPVAADRTLLAGLHDQWRTRLLPEYRRAVDDGERAVEAADPARLIGLVNQIGDLAGRYLWSLALVGGSAWKIEARLTGFVRRHLAGVLEAGPQVLLTGLPGAEPRPAAHAVHSLDWYRPTSGELGSWSDAAAEDRHHRQAAARIAAEQACRTALADRPKLLGSFVGLLRVAQRYTVIREQQAADLTLGWPLLRCCVHRLGDHLVAAGAVAARDDIFFLTYGEMSDALCGVRPGPAVPRRRPEWERHRRLPAPLTLGTPPRLIGDPIARAVAAARGTHSVPAGSLVGHPAGAGRATGRVRVVDGPADFAAFGPGEILVAKATAPAWTPLFARAAAVVTDGGTLAAHASLVAREYGIPAVVGTGDATARLRTGEMITVDGGIGVVIPAARS